MVAGNTPMRPDHDLPDLPCLHRLDVTLWGCWLATGCRLGLVLCYGCPPMSWPPHNCTAAKQAVLRLVARVRGRRVR